MIYIPYTFAWSLAAGPAALWLLFRAKHRALLHRFAPRVPHFDQRPLWVHACSVGEVNTARPILEAMAKRWPSIPLCLTVSTVSGMRLAQSIDGLCPVTWFPFDHPWIVRRFIRRLKPRTLALIETELWPGVLREAKRAGVPVALLNGRLSNKHFPRYLRTAFVWKSIIGNLEVAAMQDEEYVRRIVLLGLPSTRAHATGNTKFDGVRTEMDPRIQDSLRAEMGFSTEDSILVFGSTRPGDEKLAAACWAELHEAFPSLRMVVAPRHLERVDEALECFDEPVLRRSDADSKRAPSERIVLVDTLGELPLFYSLASIAVIGGSFYPGVEGHNPLESAALGVPTLFGPYMANFKAAAARLAARGGAVQLGGPDELCKRLHGLLSNPAERAALGRAGREAIAENQGAIDHNLDLIEPLLN